MAAEGHRRAGTGRAAVAAQEGWENSPLRQRFMHAGYRNPSAPAVFFGIKTILTFALPGLFMLYAGIRAVPMETASLLGGLLLLAAAGYYLPNSICGGAFSSASARCSKTFPTRST
jgi:tight adherence protein C